MKRYKYELFKENQCRHFRKDTEQCTIDVEGRGCGKDVIVHKGEPCPFDGDKEARCCPEYV
jgi:hypothetical protein